MIEDERKELVAALRRQQGPLYHTAADEIESLWSQVVLHTRHLYDLGIKIEQLDNERDDALTVCERLLKEKADRGFFP